MQSDLPQEDAIEIFISYARRDRQACAVLVEHLALLRRQGHIKEWHDGMLRPGDDWKGVIFQKMQTAQIILLLISKNFLASDFAWGIELHKALERHRRGEVRVIPIILSPCDLSDAPFMQLHALPTDAKPIARWKDPDEAWLDVVTQLRTLVEITQDSIREQRGIPQERARPLPDESRKVSTILSRYSQAQSWLSDLHNFFGAVAGVGGISRVVRTFGMLSFRFDAFVSYVLSTPDTEENQNHYLGPPNCLVLFNIITLALVLAVQQFTIFNVVDFHVTAMAIALTIIGLIVFGIGLRFLSAQKRTTGEYMAMVCYVCGAFMVPLLLFMTFGIIVVVFMKSLINSLGHDLLILILSIGGIIFLIASPFMLANGVRRFTGRVSWSRNLVVSLTSVLFMGFSGFIMQPGNIVLLGAMACSSINQEQCADSLGRIAVSFQPKSEVVWVFQINKLQNQGGSIEAERFLVEALKMHPKSEKLHYLMATNGTLNDPGQVEQELMTALSLNPEFEPAARELIQHFMSQNKHEQLLQYCNVILSASRFTASLNQQCKIIIGAMLLGKGRVNEAATHFRELLNLPLDNEQRAKAQAYLQGLRWLKPELLQGKIIISSVVHGSLAAKVGLRAADIVLSLDGYQPDGIVAWRKAIRDRPSSVGQLTILRESGQTTLALPPTPKLIGIKLDQL